MNQKDQEYLQNKLLNKYENFVDIDIDVEAQLGSAHLSIRELLKLDIGSVIDLKQPISSHSELFANNKIFGKGEITIHKKNLAIRINSILDSKTLIQQLKKEF